MKAKRHAKILEIIHAQSVTTQEDLMQRLSEAGFAVTQATVSRDIKELRLIKTLDASGRYCYTPAAAKSDSMSGQFYSLFADAVQTVDYAGNIVIVKCYPGMAQAVCASLDSVSFKDVVGTLAGEDTFVCFVKSEDRAIGLVAELKKLSKRG